MALYLSGGGDAEDTAQLDRAFVAALGEGPLAYWPFARAPETYPACLAWFTTAMAALGMRRSRIEMWTECAGALSGCGGLYIGGGDTYRLMAALRASGLDRAVVEAAAGGLPIFGGSAGAIILGADITTWVADGDARPTGAAARGLDLLDGHSVWAEYAAPDAPAAAAWVGARGSPLLGLGCAAGVIVERGAMRACGSEPVIRISAAGVTSFADGTRLRS